MFKLQPNPTFKAKVGISIPGQAKPEEIEVEFRWFTRAKFNEWRGNLKDRQDIDALQDIVVGWSGVEEAFSPAVLGQMLDNYPRAAGDLFDAFYREITEAKRKN